MKIKLSPAARRQLESTRADLQRVLDEYGAIIARIQKISATENSLESEVRILRSSLDVTDILWPSRNFLLLNGSWSGFPTNWKRRANWPSYPNGSLLIKRCLPVTLCAAFFSPFLTKSCTNLRKFILRCLRAALARKMQLANRIFRFVFSEGLMFSPTAPRISRACVKF
jgi:hypothetical protein